MMAGAVARKVSKNGVATQDHFNYGSGKYTSNAGSHLTSAATLCFVVEFAESVSLTLAMKNNFVIGFSLLGQGMANIWLRFHPEQRGWILWDLLLSLFAGLFFMGLIMVLRAKKGKEDGS